MERMTRRTPDGTAYSKSFAPISEHMMMLTDRLAAYEDIGLTPDGVKKLQADYIEIANRTYGPLHHQIAEWVKADEDGRLVVLPCKVGDAVFVRMDDGAPYMARVQGISISSTGKDTILKFGGYPAVSVWGSDLGKTWFRSLQEAEEALRKVGSP